VAQGVSAQGSVAVSIAGSGFNPSAVLRSRTVPACTGAELAVTTGPQVAGLSHWGVPIEFANRGAAPCHVQGYPRVVGVNASGKVVLRARQTPSGYLGGLEETSAPPLVTLRPGQRASALMEGVAGPESCPTYRALLVTPPGGTRARPVRVPLGFPGCPGLQVHPVVPGTSGRLS
jgi:hypothetical protein